MTPKDDYVTNNVRRGGKVSLLDLTKKEGVYPLMVALGLLFLLSCLSGFVSIFLLLIRAIFKKGLSYRTNLIIGGASLAVFFFSSISSIMLVPSKFEAGREEGRKAVKANDTTKNEEKKEEKKEEPEEPPKKEKPVIKPVFEATMNLKVVDKKVRATVDSNVPDGGLFELEITNQRTGVKRKVLPIKDGKVVHEFQIPKEWGVGEITGSAMFWFDDMKHPQPKHVQDIFGEKGEKMRGNQVKDHKSGKYGLAQAGKIPYPSEKAIQAEEDRSFQKKIKALVKSGQGLILTIKPQDGKDGWQAVNVKVSDQWYSLAHHEKERFVETVSESVEEIVIKSGKDSYTVVYFVDRNGKEVARPKFFGGYNIK